MNGDVVDVEVMNGDCVVGDVVAVVGGGSVEDAYVGCIAGLVSKGAVTESCDASASFFCFAFFSEFFCGLLDL